MSDMETRVRELEISQAKQEVVVDQLKQVVLENTKAITELTAVLNKGRGAAWTMAGAYTLFGGLVGYLVNLFKG